MNPLFALRSLFRQALVAGEEAESGLSDPVLRRRASFRVVVISLTVMLSLTLIRYFGEVYYFYELGRLFGFDHLLPSGFAGPDYEIMRLGWWVFVVAVGYALLPMLVIKWVLKEKIRDYGFRGKGIKKDFWLYAYMLILMIPLVFWVGNSPAFQAKYPFYPVQAGEGLSANFWCWELMYFFQFFTLEFFFRGFMVHGSKARFGFYAVFFMCIPYCMIHFSKPFGETLGAIAAGIALGALSLKSRSIWLGTLLHYSVAITMDLVSLYYKGLL